MIRTPTGQCALLSAPDRAIEVAIAMAIVIAKTLIARPVVFFKWSFLG